MLRDREALEEYKELKKRLNAEFVALDQPLTEISRRIGAYAARIGDDLDDYRYPRISRYVDDLCATVRDLDETPLRVYAALARVAKDVLLDDWGTDYWAVPGKVGYTPSGEIPRWAEDEEQDALFADDDLPEPAADGEEQEDADREETAAELLDRIHRCAAHLRDLFASFAEVWTAVRSAAEIGDDSALTFELAKLRRLPDALRSAFAVWTDDVDLLYEVSPETLGHIRAVVRPTPGQLEIF
ncbi:hypothetical protein [Thermobifida cellulosilytica]|uniref:Uncharacterized protein n=1 Tax=Thermobifida cellulosilytica TB100 TaxID=665004 RepID=A0A147KM05_THECS|nr:hypothetical protein [Thermobifida cellulosilytica]KUP98360.1 hypothetical protein AC529_01855 [Thermobifida cellulosilytica TB100]